MRRTRRLLSAVLCALLCSGAAVGCTQARPGPMSPDASGWAGALSAFSDAAVRHDARALRAMWQPERAQGNSAAMTLLADLPIAEHTLRGCAPREGGAEGAEEGVEGGIRLRCTEAVRLADLDAGPWTRTLDLDLTVTDGRWLLASSASAAEAPWEVPAGRVARGEGVLVVAPASLSPDLVVRQAVTARAEVARVLGRTAAPLVVTTATDPTDPTGAQPTGGDPSASRVTDEAPAVTAGPVDDDGRARADRILLRPGAWGALPERARQFLLTHEAAHVTLRRAVGGTVAAWVGEGVADEIALDGAGLTDAQWLGALQKAPPGLRAFPPADRVWGATAAHRAAGYAASALSVRLTIDELIRARAPGGSRPEALGALWSGSLGPRGSSDAALEARADRALIALGLDPVALAAAWEARVRTALGRLP